MYHDLSFDSFWDAYPCKLDRDEALSAWREIAPDDAVYEKIMAGIAAWKKTTRWKNEGGRYIPTAGNFLKRGYWQEAPAEPVPQTPKTAACELGQTELENIQRLLREGNIS